MKKARKRVRKYDFPCTQDCPNRKAGCHDRRVCPAWGEYEDREATRRATETVNFMGRMDFAAVRHGSVKRTDRKNGGNTMKDMIAYAKDKFREADRNGTDMDMRYWAAYLDGVRATVMSMRDSAKENRA